jgi:hypothetical protein
LQLGVSTMDARLQPTETTPQSPHSGRDVQPQIVGGGSGGIRTHGTVPRTLVFKTRALNHSATLPDIRQGKTRERCRDSGFDLILKVLVKRNGSSATRQNCADSTVCHDHEGFPPMAQHALPCKAALLYHSANQSG